jgi:hypothetical protein
MGYKERKRGGIKEEKAGASFHTSNEFRKGKRIMLDLLQLETRGNYRRAQNSMQEIK